MKPYKTIARITGVLFIVATFASLISTGFLNPILSKSDYLTKMSANNNQIITGVLFLLIGAFASAAIAISMYPVLRKYNEGLAIGSVGFRIIEGMLYMVGAVGILSLLTLSQNFVKAGTPVSSYFQTQGTTLLQVRDWTTLTAVMAFYIGAMMYYWIFYKYQLIPRWLSGWGIIGVILGIVAAILVLFRVTGTMSMVDIVFNIPIGIQEMVLAVWLIVKGFSKFTIASGVTKQT
jgi:hypothetical protein